jgi:hypothetical protein
MKLTVAFGARGDGVYRRFSCGGRGHPRRGRLTSTGGSVTSSFFICGTRLASHPDGVEPLLSTHVGCRAGTGRGVGSALFISDMPGA